MINKAEVRKLAKESERRLSADFLSALEYAVRQKVQACLATHNGGKKTLDGSVVHYVFNTAEK